MKIVRYRSNLRYRSDLHLVFSRGHKTTPCHVRPSHCLSVGNIFVLRVFFHYCSCPTIRDCASVYPALLFYDGFKLFYILYETVFSTRPEKNKMRSLVALDENKQDRIHGYPSRKRVGRGIEGEGHCGIWAGAVSSKSSKTQKK